MPAGCHHDVDAEDVDGAPQIIGDRGEAERGADIVEAPHQEGARVHPLLERPEGMFDGITAPCESVQQSGHSVQHCLIVQTRDPAAGSPSRPDRTDRARRRIAAIGSSSNPGACLRAMAQGFLRPYRRTQPGPDRSGTRPWRGNHCAPLIRKTEYLIEGGGGRVCRTSDGISPRSRYARMNLQRYYNEIRPHSLLGYRPPTPPVLMPARPATQPDAALPRTPSLAQRPTLN